MMNSPKEAKMTTKLDKVCDICGEIGAAELIATCFKCNLAREHIYCMQLFRSRVPKVWFCADCLSNMFETKSGAMDTQPRKGKRTLLAPQKKKVCRKRHLDSLMPAKEIGAPSLEIQEGLNCEPLPSEDVISHHNSGEGAGPVNVLPEPKQCLVNKLATDATWWGSFEIVDTLSRSEFYNGFESYAPVRVHPKAYQFSKQMPGVLLSTLLPRRNIWGNIFKNDHPNENDVALYFFPSTFERSKEQYVCLLQRMDKEDLVLRSYINGVELLIFTSKWLHVSSGIRINLEIADTPLELRWQYQILRQGWSQSTPREAHDPPGFAPSTIILLKLESFLWGIFRKVKANQTVSLPSCDLDPLTSGHLYNIGTKFEEQLLKVKLEKFTYLDVLSWFSTQAADEASEEMNLGPQLQVQGSKQQVDGGNG